MILRHILYDLFIAGLFLQSKGQLFGYDQEFDCHDITVQGIKYNLTSLAGEHVVNRTRNTEPTSMVDSLRFNLCADLTAQPDVPDTDQCPQGTRACLLQVNKKDQEQDRVISVIPIAVTDKLDPKFSSNAESKLLSVLLHGTDYPSTNPRPQSLNLTLLCDEQAKFNLKVVDYDGSRLDIEWSTPAGCPVKDDGGEHSDEGGNKKPEEPAEDHMGSGIGWFFLVLLLAFLAYFGLGAYYNYSTYGSTGYDLIPHRDFWKEVPYMLSDVVSHLCSNVRPRRTSSRGGYISV